MKKSKRELSLDNVKLFSENETDADIYSAYCMLFAVGISLLMWLLNFVGIFTVNKENMNMSMLISIPLMLLPPVLVLGFKARGAWVKYMALLCFIFGISTLSSTLTIHMVLAWACPLALSLHYYSPKFTRFVLFASIAFMFCSINVGIFIGVWDNNVMRGALPKGVTDGIGARVEYIKHMKTQNIDIITRNLIFYFTPRAAIVCVVYAICATLSSRTHKLLEKQSDIISDRERLSAELDVAGQIQTSMLPCIFPAFPECESFDIYASMTPAKEVGGDFYDFFMVDDTHLAIVMADVSGKGVPAALFMVIGKTLIKDHTQPGRDLGEVFGEVNKLLCESNSEGLFITAFEGVLDLETGRFVFVNAGHEMPFVCKAGGNFEAYKIRPGFVLAGFDETVYRQGEMMLEEGDMIFQYTDGVTEATNSEKQLYGMERIEEILNKVKDLAPAEMLPIIKADIDGFAGEEEQFDDITMLCLKFKKKMTKQ